MLSGVCCPALSLGAASRQNRGSRARTGQILHRSGTPRHLPALTGDTRDLVEHRHPLRAVRDVGAPHDHADACPAVFRPRTRLSAPEDAPRGKWFLLRVRLRALRAPLVTLSQRQLTVATGMAVARLAGFATGAIVARALGPLSFGGYTIGFTVFASLMQLTSFADTWLVSRWDQPARRPAVARTVWSI